MKKLKIFLLLSILLCFGFVLNYEVHAQGDGPKIFEVGDTIPANTIVRVSWTDYISKSNFSPDGTHYINGTYFSIRVSRYSTGIESFGIYIQSDKFAIIDSPISGYNNFISPYTQYGGDHAYCDILVSVPIIISQVDEKMNIFTWELLGEPILQGYNVIFEENGGTTQTDLTEQTTLPDPLPIPTKENHTFVGWYYDSDFFNEAFAGDPLTEDVTLYARWLPGKLFEEDEVLPATTELKIRILFHEYGDYHVETVDPSGIYISIDWIGGIEKDFYVKVGGLVRYDGETTASEIIYTFDISNLSPNQRTIKSVTSENGIFVTWEDATPDGYTQGYLTAREEFGYYDSRTNEWLSVEEYLELYGTDKPGQSDFYANFDKYFIPAMIIVFGGAIVLTILKVFKGRE